MPQGTLKDGQGAYSQPQAAPLQVLNGPYLALQGAQTVGRLPREARVTLTCRMGTLLGGQGKDTSANFAEPEGARAEALVVLGEAARDGLARHEQALRLQAMTGEVRGHVRSSLGLAWLSAHCRCLQEYFQALRRESDCRGLASQEQALWLQAVSRTCFRGLQQKSCCARMSVKTAWAGRHSRAGSKTLLYMNVLLGPRLPVERLPAGRLRLCQQVLSTAKYHDRDYAACCRGPSHGCPPQSCSTGTTWPPHEPSLQPLPSRRAC